MFKNIFESYPKIPETIKKDPKKIIDYVNAQDKAKDAVSNLDKDGASTIVGAKPEDYEYLGYKQTPKGASLSEQLKKKRWSHEYEGFDGNDGVTGNICSKKCIFYKIAHYDQTRRRN